MEPMPYLHGVVVIRLEKHMDREKIKPEIPY